MDRPGTIVVGAGLAGLALAYKISEAGKPVCVLERESAVGGLARSFGEKDFVFDIGPHRFHTENAAVLAFIREVLAADQLEIVRKSGVWMFDRYHDWPLTPFAAFGMPFPVLRAVGRDFFRHRPGGGATFEQHILNRYGQTLYEIFFRPYTEKFLKLPCSAVSRDWAIAGLDRAVIDRRIDVSDLWALARSLLFPQPPLSFIYPKSGGIGVFCERMAAAVRQRGGAILCGAPVEALQIEAGRVRGVVAGGTVHPCDSLVWTGSVNELFRLLGLDVQGLEYLSLLLYNYRVSRDTGLPYQWCYFGSSEIPFNRISIPSRFNPALSPRGHMGLCVEVTCLRGDAVWEDPLARERPIREALVRVGAIGSQADILDVSVKRIPEAYPIYALGYREKREKAEEALRGFSNVRTLGRTGTFQYNNMDNSLEDSLKLFAEFTRGGLT